MYMRDSGARRPIVAFPAAGWSARALFEASQVSDLHNLMNRIIEGTGVNFDYADDPSRHSALGTDPADQCAFLSRFWKVVHKTLKYKLTVSHDWGRTMAFTQPIHIHLFGADHAIHMNHALVGTCGLCVRIFGQVYGVRIPKRDMAGSVLVKQSIEIENAAFRDR